jgi:hypothetical protein
METLYQPFRSHAADAGISQDTTPPKLLNLLFFSYTNAGISQDNDPIIFYKNIYLVLLLLILYTNTGISQDTAPPKLLNLRLLLLSLLLFIFIYSAY